MAAPADPPPIRLVKIGGVVFLRVHCAVFCWDDVQQIAWNGQCVEVLTSNSPAVFMCKTSTETELAAFLATGQDQ